ncbi:MAG: lysophospholipid acyltransferase family protein [Thermoleophilaceae bacterium]
MRRARSRHRQSGADDRDVRPRCGWPPARLAAWWAFLEGAADSSPISRSRSGRFGHRIDRLPWKGPAVIVANHASLVDILVGFGLYRPFKWVSKRSNFAIPFIGWNMRLNGYVELIRGDRDSVLSMLARCSVLIGQGNPVLLFPEGTRSHDGKLRPFKDGAFELAIEHGVPLIPVALHGTGSALPKHGMVLREHVDAHVDVLAPLDPVDYDSVAELRDASRDRIAAALCARDLARA